MSEVNLQENNRRKLVNLTCDLILERSKKDLCCLCGGKTEDRKKLGDRYCHKCKEPWSAEKILSLFYHIRETDATVSHSLLPVQGSLWTRLRQRVLRK